MSRESESEQTQRTVAELLAQYGAGSGEVAPRRRRRRAEDASDTAPQAIIDRVNSDSGRLLPIRDEPAAPPPGPPPVPAGPPLPQRARPTEPERTAYQQPVRPEPALPAVQPGAGRPDHPPGARLDVPQPPPGRVEPPGRPDPRARLDPQAGRPPAPPAPSAAEETRQVPPITDDFPDDYDFAGEASRSNLGQADLTQTNLAPPNLTPPNLAPPNLAPPNPGPPNQLSGSHPKPNIPPAGPPTPPPAEASRANLVRPGPPVRDPVTEVLPRITDKLTPNVPLESLPTESVLIVPPAPATLPDPLPDQSAEDWFGDDEDEPRPAEPESTQFHPYVDLDEEEDDQDDDHRRPARADFDPADFDDEPAGLADVDADPEEPVERSPGKEWLVMIGQLAIGVVGGAALWLGFSFLWRTLAPAALVVALAVTVGLVMLVRRIRRADDLQTTILAVLVGLIVTVSPAAMLLVKS
ncbi:hypothetical protein ABZ816_12000 [Actinosynnema sp. NPDC047251]|uniref:Uncharacterized protein n=1 Tax=Saccharothrix espanaensis (strain ATCC 51144 / DSM 44229 / JCM 9112 / NBRC 15066 / NRRL 15764) TaxID=1179773 RepID=K0KAJ4_SACES|nr:hypothetical protein [Saccharothrix espanaensis]CCH35321.1 hypothetical protein BN6_81040 [Saccharothrix espanaensis DSM 44229]